MYFGFRPEVGVSPECEQKALRLYQHTWSTVQIEYVVLRHISPLSHSLSQVTLRHVKITRELTFRSHNSMHIVTITFPKPVSSLPFCISWAMTSSDASATVVLVSILLSTQLFHSLVTTRTMHSPRHESELKLSCPLSRHFIRLPPS
jgi:hypothetical protein